MRKWVVVFFAVCLLTAIGSAVVIRDTRNSVTDVRVTVVSETGDAKYADGLTVETLRSMEQVRWQSKSEWKQGEVTTAATCESYGAKQVFFSDFFRFHQEMNAYLKIENAEELWKTKVSTGEYDNGKVPLREISYYYPLDVVAPYNYYELAVTDFVKIRSLEKELVSIEKISSWCRRDDTGEIEIIDSYGYNSSLGEDYYVPEIRSAETDTAIYFVFNNRSIDGTLMDFSDTTGGYGIYRMPVYPETGWEDNYAETSEGVKFYDTYRLGAVEQFLSVDSSKNAIGLSVDEGMNTLFLLYVTDGRYEIAVVDILGAKVLAEIPLGIVETTEDLDFTDYGGPDCGAFFEFTTSELFVVRKTTEGTWELLRINMEEKDNPFVEAYRYHRYIRMACDGERTAFVCYMPDEKNGVVYDGYVSFDLWIYAEGELKFKTVFRSSFDEANYYLYPGNYSSKMEMQDYRIRFAE